MISDSGKHSGFGYPDIQIPIEITTSNQLKTSNILQAKNVLTLSIGSNPEVCAISLEWVLQGLNVGSIHSPQMKTPEQVLVQTSLD